jgi:hypothetical protein
LKLFVSSLSGVELLAQAQRLGLGLIPIGEYSVELAALFGRFLRGGLLGMCVLRSLLPQRLGPFRRLNLQLPQRVFQLDDLPGCSLGALALLGLARLLVLCSLRGLFVSLALLREALCLLLRGVRVLCAQSMDLLLELCDALARGGWLLGGCVLAEPPRQRREDGRRDPPQS